MQETIEQKNKILALVAVVMYLGLEPMLTQMYAVHAYAIIETPYRLFRLMLPWIVFAHFGYKIIKKKGEIHYGALIPVMLLFVTYLVPTALAGENMHVWYETVIPLLAYYLFLIPLCRDKENLSMFVGYVSDVYLALAVVNLVFVIWPRLFEMVGPWSPEAFLTTIENQVGFPLVMGLMFCLLDEHFNNRKWVLFIYVAVYVVSNYLMWTAAQVIGVAVFVLYLIPCVRKCFDKSNIILWAIVGFALFIVVVFFWEPIKQIGVIKFIMEGVLKKDVTFSGRLHIWNLVWEEIKKKPIIGYGLMENPQYMVYDGEWNWNFVHAHNGFLQTWYEAGIISLIAVAALFVFSGIKTRKCKDRKLIGIFNLILFIFLINFEMDEFFIYPWRTCMWCMMCFICNFAVVVTENDY